MDGPFSHMYVNVINGAFRARQEKNPSYSLRAFAKSINIDPSALSRILAGKQNPSIKLARKISLGLKLTREEKILFFLSIAEDIKRRALQSLAKDIEDENLSSTCSLSVHSNLEGNMPPAKNAHCIEGVVLSLDPSKISTAQKKIQQFIKELCELLETDAHKSLYQLSIQLFPLHNKKP